MYFYSRSLLVYILVASRSVEAVSESHAADVDTVLLPADSLCVEVDGDDMTSS